MRNRRWLITALALLTILVSTGIVQAQGGRSNFDWIVARRITITGAGLTVQTDATINDDLTVDDDANVTGDLTAGTLTGSTFFQMSEATAITLTNASTLTPTGTIQPITSAGAIGFGAIAGCAAGTAGRLLVLENNVAQTITITDSATLRMAGNFAMGQYDTIIYLCDGATYVELTRANN